MDKELDTLFESYVDLYHKHTKALDTLDFFGDQLLEVKTVNALLKQEIKQLEGKLKLKEIH